jgi:hypothetical protein
MQENLKRGRPLLLPLQAIPTPSIARRGAPFLQPPFIIISKYFKNLRGISNPPYWKWGGGGVRSLGIYVEVFLTNGRWEGICKTSANITVLLCQTLKSYYKTTFYPSLPFFKKNKLKISC